ncbi:MAG: hypothetical protein PHW13_03610 [Methylococcales bacterium]|nr:hypothetical protein [Methylococcales bacterium]
MSTITISSGTSSSGVVVSSGSLENIQNGGSSINTLVMSGGTDDVYGTSISATINAGGSQDVETGGVASGATVNGGFQGVVGGAVFSTLIENKGVLLVTSGEASGVTVSGGNLYDYGTVVSTTVLSAGFEVVFSGGHDSATTVQSGGNEVVQSGGFSNNDTIGGGGVELVQRGGTGSGAILSGGTLIDSGSVTGTQIQSGGQQIISSGGQAVNTVVLSGGLETVQSGGVTSNAIVSSGGGEQVSGTAGNVTVLSGGSLTLNAGGQLSGGTVQSGGIVTGLVLSSGSLTFGAGTQVIDGISVQSGAMIGLEVGSGASISGFTDNGETLKVDFGGTASGAVLNSGGIENLYGGANVTTINSGGVENVYSGGVENGSVINSGGNEYIFSGGTVNGGTVENGGTLTVQNGGVDNGTTVASGGTLIISSGGIVSGLILDSGAHLTLLSGGELIGAVTESGGNVGGLILTSGSISATSGGFVINGTVLGGPANVLEIGSGASASGLTDTGLTFKIDLGGIASGVTLGSGGVENLYGAANATTINSGGVENVYSGGVDSGVIINGGGSENVSGGAVNGATVESGATLTVLNGGVDSNSTIVSGGTLVISSGGVVSGVNFESGANLTLLSGGELTGTVTESGNNLGGLILTSGSINATSGGFVLNGTVFGGAAHVLEIGSGASLTVSGLTDSGGQVKIDLGGVASGVILGGSGTEDNSGTDNGITINSGGMANVYAGGVESGSIINAGGSENISGGAGSAAMIGSGGTLTVFSAGTDSGSTIQNGGNEYISGGLAGATTIESGGTLTVFAGSANGSIVQNGGTENISGGVVSAATVESGGTLNIFSGGIDSGSTLNGGLEFISNGGVASGATVESGGWLTVNSGGIADGALIGNGGIVEFDTAVNSGVSVTFGSGAGNLLLDIPKSFAGSILGFNTGDSIDLTSVGSVSSASWSGGVLTIGTRTGSLTLDVVGNYAGDTFTTASDGFGGTLINLSTPSTPAITSVGYNAQTGVLTLSGTNLTTAAGDYSVTDFSLTGDGGVSYTLTGGSVISGAPTNTGFSIQLSAADQLAVDGLLNKSGTMANDGLSVYNLSATAGWDTGAGTVTTQAISVSNVAAPSISSVGYDAATGVFTVTGSNFTNHGGSNGIAVANFTASDGSGGGYTFSTGNDIVSNLTTSGFTITLSSADKALVNANVDANGNTTLGGAAYNFSASANWDSDSGAAIATQAVTVSGVSPSLTGVAYDEATGVMTLSGSNFTALAADYSLTDFTFKGDGGTTYTLNNGSVITGTPTGASLTIQLSAADQLALDGLLNKTGYMANDGTVYNLSAPAGWDTAAASAITGETFNVSNVTAPSISSVSYDAATGAFTVTGGNFTNHGGSNGIALADFTLSAGSGNYAFSTGNDIVSNLTASGFTITLSSADKALVNANVDANGNTTLGGAAYNFSASANWDSDSGAAINTQAVTVSGVNTPTLGAVAYNAATGILTLSGTNFTTAASDYSGADFSLTGEGGVMYTLTGGSVISGTPTSVGFSIQLSAADQLAVDGLLNKSGTTANDGVSVYNLSAAAGWDTAAGAVTTEAVSVSNVVAPAITGVSYDAASGVFTFSGSHLVNAGGGNGIALQQFGVSGDKGATYNFSTTNDTVGNLTANGFTVTLNSADRAAVNGILDANGSLGINGSAYNLTAAANWDSGSGNAISTQAVVVSGLTPVLTGSAYNAATGVLTLSGANMTTAASDYTVTDISLKGDGGVMYTLTGGSVISGTPTSAGFSIQLSAADQLAVDGLLNKSGTTANDGVSVYNLSAAAGWDTAAAAAVATDAVSVSNVTAPSIANVNYDAATGVFTVTGGNFTNHGGNNGIALGDFTLSAGSGSYAFSAANDTVGNLSASAFTITLNSADRATVNAFVDANGSSSLAGAAYNFSAGANWDSNSGSAFTSNAVSVNGVPPTLTGVAYDAKSGVLTLSGHNLTATASDYNIGDFTLKGDGGAAYTLTGGSLSGTATSSSVSIQLSAADQVAVNGLLNSNGAMAIDGTGYSLSASSGWDTAGAAISGEAITVSNVTAPTISAVSYNATTGVLSVSGENLTNHGASNGIAIGDLTITGGLISKKQIGSITLNAVGDTVSNLTATGFNLNLGIADKEKLDLFVTANGISPLKGPAYNLSATASWDSDSGAAIGAQTVIVSNVQPNVDTASYNYTTGKLTLTGNYLTGGYKIPDLTITGYNGIGYTLTKGSVVSARQGSNSVTIHLSAADQLAVDGLLDKQGNTANDNVSSLYNLSAVSGWDKGASAFGVQSITVTNVITPAISKVVYNAASGVFTFIGAHLVNSGGNNGINLSNLSVGSNLGSFNFSSLDTLGKLSSTHFTVTLNSTDKAAILADFNANGVSSGSGTAYNLTAAAGWDSGNGLAISSQSVIVNHGKPFLSAASYNAATGVLTLSGEFLTAKAGGYNVGSFTLQGDGGAKYRLTGSSHVVSISGSTSVSIDLSARDQLAVNGLLNHDGVKANDGTTYNLSAAAGWDAGAAGIKTQAITASTVVAPTISAVSYNAATGVLTVIGADFTRHGSANGVVLSNFTLSGVNGGLTFGGKDAVGKMTANSFIITLNHADQVALNSHLDANGGSSINGTAYNLAVAANWDSDSGSAIATQTVSVFNLKPILTGSAYDATTGVLTLTGANLTSLTAGYKVADFTIKGDGGAAYTLSHGSAVTGTPSSGSVSILLSAKDQLAIDGLLNHDGTQANDGTAYNLSAAAGWDTGASAIKTQAISVGNVVAPTISTVSYDAKTGVFTVAGAALDNHGSAGGINVKDFSLTDGVGSYVFTGSDKVSKLSADGFTLTLSGADKTLVNSFVNANGTTSSTGAAYELNAAAGWDSDSGAAISNQSVTVSGLATTAAVAAVSVVGVHDSLGLITVA